MMNQFFVRAGSSTLWVFLVLVGAAKAQEPEKLLPVENEIRLFNGQDLRGWHFFARDEAAKPEDVWSVEDGVLRSKGRPVSYLQTSRWYRDYQLDLEWRWPGDRGGNSGVLVHSSTPLLFYGWPKSMEVQLQAGAAGDFWVIGDGVDVRVPDEANRRAKPVPGNQHQHRRIRRLAGDFEKPVGQWNQIRIICRDRQIDVWVNGQQVNQGTQLTVTEGGIALQAEGTPIEFRDIRLSPLPRGE